MTARVKEILGEKFTTITDIDNAFFARFEKHHLFTSIITQYEHSNNRAYENEEIVKIMEIARELAVFDLKLNTGNPMHISRKQAACIVARGLFGLENKIGLFGIVLDFNSRAFTHLLNYFVNVKKRPASSKITIIYGDQMSTEDTQSNYDDMIDISLINTITKPQLESPLHRIEYLESISYKNDFCLQFPECFILPKLAPKSPVAMTGLEQYSDSRGPIDDNFICNSEMSTRSIIFSKLRDVEDAYTIDFYKELEKIVKNLKLAHVNPKNSNTFVIIYDRSELNITFRAFLHIIASIQTSIHIIYKCSEEICKSIHDFLKFVDNEQMSLELIFANYEKIIKEIKRDQLNNYNQINTKKVNFMEWIMHID